MGFETPKIPRSYNEQKEMPKSSEAQRVASLARVLLTHQSHIQIYSREGKYLFQGCLNDCIVAWKSGSFDDPIHLGGIADRFGESIIRFGPGDDHGFVDRRWIQPLFEDLYALLFLIVQYFLDVNPRNYQLHQIALFQKRFYEMLE